VSRILFPVDVLITLPRLQTAWHLDEITGGSMAGFPRNEPCPEGFTADDQAPAEPDDGWSLIPLK
jgi:hypothetical protein